MVQILLVLLSLFGVAFAFQLGRTLLKQGGYAPAPEAIALGAVTNFFDSLGIGSYAPSTAWIRLRRLTADANIPATLTVGHCLPSVVEALIFIQIVKVDPILLAGCIGSAVLGSIVGVRLVVRAPVRVVQGMVGIALTLAAIAFAMTNLKLMPGGGTALSLPLAVMLLVFAVHFVLGALMTFGIGMYAPSLILLSLLGLNPVAAFPIMMGACAFLMPVAGVEFLRKQRLDLRVVTGIALGGIPAIFVGAFLVKSLPLTMVRWGVVVVVVYAALQLLLSAFRAAKPAPAPAT
ncbi:MAG TPA: TSUP family transporter [Caulobacteraceae bacterium]|jgi:uncharacterized membrane protein YfcA|nr:TSUP family transporter [Caulobacteraceae bacterium]